MHNHNFPFVVWEFGEHFFFDELDSDDLISGELISFVHGAKIALAQFLGLVHIELRRNFFHSAADETPRIHDVTLNYYISTYYLRGMEEIQSSFLHTLTLGSLCQTRREEKSVAFWQLAILKMDTFFIFVIL